MHYMIVYLLAMIDPQGKNKLSLIEFNQFDQSIELKLY